MNLLEKNKGIKSRLIFRGVIFTLMFISLAQQSSAVEPQNGSNNASTGAVSVLRDPFWPVGYKPAWTQSKEEYVQQQILTGKNGKTDWSIAMGQVVINGVSSRGGNEYVAVINNEVKLVGEAVSLWHGGTFYTWAVESISPPGSVKLRRVSAE